MPGPDHTLLPAFGTQKNVMFVPLVPTAQIPSWTLIRPGTVIMKIWPAVLAQTLFAAVIVYLQEFTIYDLSIDNVLLTVMGVVIGFVISYRASSGYDRYWMGRTAWAGLIQNSRTLSRLIWYHVPPRLTPPPAGDVKEPAHQEVEQVLGEKKTALTLIEAFAVALKHHLRGEMGIYYEDLYPLVGVLPHASIEHPDVMSSPTPMTPGALPDMSAITVASPAHIPEAAPRPINGNPVDRMAYGVYANLDHTHNGVPHHITKTPDRPLLPSRSQHSTTWSTDLIPFASLLMAIGDFLMCREFESKTQKEMRLNKRLSKHVPLIAGGGDNVPMEVVGCLSEWLATLDARGTMNGNAAGQIYGCLNSFENSLTETEKILTTPLPFVYSVHLRQTVWLYLFFLPFQLAKQFRWLTVLGVLAASFFYLGFLAAGDELEQPFGYDHNDLDLDLFCHIISKDLDILKNSSTPFSYLALAGGNLPQGRIADEAAKAETKTLKMKSASPPTPPR